MNYQNIGLIPSRMESTRLPGKPLLEIDGVPMIIRVYQNAIKSKTLDYVAVCTDSEQIHDAMRHIGGNVILTSKDHSNGTTRIAEAAGVLWGQGLTSTHSVIVDIQGDDPLVCPDTIDDLVKFHRSQKDFESSISLSVGEISSSELETLSVVKVIPGANDSVYALTRSPDFPCRFRGADYPIYKHLSTIAFSGLSLATFSNLPLSQLEEMEGVELCRALVNQMKINYRVTDPTISVDTPYDLERVRYLVNSNYLRNDS